MTTPLALVVQLYRPEGGWADVGRLERRDETTWFSTFSSYWDDPGRPVLGQVFEERGPTWRPVAAVALPDWFSHLLPEGRLRQAIAEDAHVNPAREFFLLARVGGDDLPGGLRVVAAEAESTLHTPEPAVPGTPGPEPDVGPYKFSLAGVQLKFSVLEGERGLTVPARGEAGDWIAKLPDLRGFDGVPQAELAGLELARSAGIDAADARLVPVSSIAGLPTWVAESGGEALLIRRFDRTPDGGRVHFEEAAQVLELPTGRDKFKFGTNFETIAKVTAALAGPEAVGDVIDRIVLNVLVGNGDAHAKNWAYRYVDGHTPTLSPAYDIVPTVLYVANENLGPKLAGSRSFDDVTIAKFRRLARVGGWDEAAGVARASEAVHRVVEAWPALADHLPAESYEQLTARRDDLPLVRSA